VAESLFTDIINNLGKSKVKVTGSGSKTGKQQIVGAPQGITSDKETINLQGSAEIPITNNVDFLLDGQYNKFRDNIEYKDDQIFLEDAPSNINRKVGIGFNKDGEGFGGYAKYDIDKEKPEFFLGYKKTFADGGSTNGSEAAALRKKVEELMDDGYEFGEAVREAMRQGYSNGGRIKLNKGGDAAKEAAIQKLYTEFGQALVDSESLKKHGKSIRDITVSQRNNLSRRLNKYKSFIKEKNRLPTETEARVEGRKDKAITDAIGKEQKKNTSISEDKIRQNMINKGETVKMIQGKVVFANPETQKEFVQELTKRYALGKTSSKAAAAGVLTNNDLYNKYFKGFYSESSVRTIIDKFKKAMDLEYNKLTPQERDINKLNRIADELITQGGKRLSGSKTSPLHHLFPLGDEYVKARGKDFAIIDEKTNAGMQFPNKNLKALVKERQQVIKDKIANKITIEEFNIKNNDINERAIKIIDTYNTKNPANKGLLNWRKLSMIDNNKVLVGEAIGGDYKQHSINPENKTLIENLNKEDLRKYRELIKKKSSVSDLKKIEGITTADKIEQPEKSKIRSMFDNFNEKFRSSKPAIQKFSSKVPGSALALAPTEFALSLAAGVPLYDAAASAGSYLLKDPAIGKAVNVPLALRAMTDYEDADEMLKRASQREQKFKNVLEGITGIDQDKPLLDAIKEKYFSQKITPTYPKIDDYLPDEELSGILSVKGVQ